MSRPSSKKREIPFRGLTLDTPAYQPDLVSIVTRELMNCSSREEVIGRLPQLLETYGKASASIWQKQGQAYAEIRGSPLQPIKLSLYEKMIEKVISTREPNCLNKPFGASVKPLSSEVSTLVLPLFEGQELLVVLKLERNLPFGDSEFRTLVGLAATVSCLLTTLAERMKSALTTRLSQALLLAQDTTTIAKQALELLLETLNLESGALLVQQGSYLHTLAGVGTLPEDFLQPGLSTTTAWLEEVHKQGQPSYYPSIVHKEPSVINTKLASFVVYPLGEILPARFILFLGSDKVRWWLQTEKDILASVAHILSLAFRSVESQTRLETLLTLENHALTESEHTLLHEILLAAVRTVPGAEAGRLLIYQGKKFYFRATVGYDTVSYDLASDELRSDELIRPHPSVRPTDIKAWHQSAHLPWDSSEPRIFSSSYPEQKQVIESLALTQSLREVEPGSGIKANLYFPVIQQGRVIAIFLLDNFSDPEAFASDSLVAVTMFASPMASLLRDNRYKHLLERAALTDPLTNLSNQMSFNQSIVREVARSHHFESPFSLLLIDIGQLKISTHLQSDAVFIEVSSVLKKVMRPSDLLFHWSGDEFAAILPNTNYQGGIVAARRCARAIKRLAKESLPIDIHIGVATYPMCANSTTTLVGVASERLNHGKTQDITVFLKEY